MSLFATAMKLVEVLHCSHHGPKPNSGEQQEKRVVDEKERSAIRSAENLIISTITHDFRNSPTIGYIRATGGGLGATGTEATHPNPFATTQQITERITSELRSAITQAEGQHVEIKCDFGMSLEDMRCHHGPLPQARSG